MQGSQGPSQEMWAHWAAQPRDRKPRSEQVALSMQEINAMVAKAVSSSLADAERQTQKKR